ncbi:aldehyde dehydrogenase family protein [Nocardia farcinica]|uniref:aldehyde dehydrogenase family protein n=1 Tax=Nocardia farcinica TaxID=37329 RepID=UPI0024537BA2|nr:aldehyde dehydrogenase family protein [Nocardia farcinica]
MAAYVFSPNAERIWCVAAALEAGMVGINSGLIPNETAPFGGIKQSGLGRGGGRSMDHSQHDGRTDVPSLQLRCAAPMYTPSVSSEVVPRRDEQGGSERARSVDFADSDPSGAGRCGSGGPDIAGRTVEWFRVVGR